MPLNKLTGGLDRSTMKAMKGTCQCESKINTVRRFYEMKRIICVLMLLLVAVAFTFGQVNEFELDVGTVILTQAGEPVVMSPVVLHLNSPWAIINTNALTYSAVLPVVQSINNMDAYVLNLAWADILRLYSKNYNPMYVKPVRSGVLQLKYPILRLPTWEPV